MSHPIRYRKTWEDYHGIPVPTGWDVHHIVHQSNGGTHIINNLLALPSKAHIRIFHPESKNWMEKQRASSGTGNVRLSGKDRTDSQKLGALAAGESRRGNTSALGKRWTLTKTTKTEMSNSRKDLWKDPDYREKACESLRGPRKKKTCPHCGKVGAGGNMHRYHFDNCKKRG